MKFGGIKVWITVVVVLLGSTIYTCIYTDTLSVFSPTPYRRHWKSKYHDKQQEFHYQVQSINASEMPSDLSNGKSTILVIGDSHIYHLNKAIENGHITDAKPNFGTGQVVKLYGIRGATVDILRTSDHLKDLLTSTHPEVVFLHIGGNDIDSDIPVNIVCGKIVKYVKELESQYGVKHVLMSEQFYRKEPRNLHRKVYGFKVLELNKILKLYNNQWFCSHFHLDQTKDKVLLEDGVHLNSLGENLFYQSLLHFLHSLHAILID